MSSLRGIFTTLLLLINTLILIGPMMLLALLRLIIPGKSAKRLLGIAVTAIAEFWAEICKRIFGLCTPTVWDIQGVESLRHDGSYLIISNHQSWVDIPALIQAFNYKTPYFRFFLKQALIWIPFLGLAFWALDYPFMKRYSKSYLRKHPEKKGQDIDITKKACEKFKSIPVTLVNYLEGTRFTRHKRDLQNSPYQYLLKPKSAGIAFAMSTLGPQLETLLNVTIFYHDSPTPEFWDLLCGRVSKVSVLVESSPIDHAFWQKSYEEDAEHRKAVHQWVASQWHTKDQTLAALYEEHRSDHSGNQYKIGHH